MTAREVAEEVSARVQLWVPAAKVELAGNGHAVWLYLPNGQTFEVAVTETAPRDVEPRRRER